MLRFVTNSFRKIQSEPRTLQRVGTIQSKYRSHTLSSSNFVHCITYLPWSSTVLIHKYVVLSLVKSTVQSFNPTNVSEVLYQVIQCVPLWRCHPSQLIRVECLMDHPLKTQNHILQFHKVRLSPDWFHKVTTHKMKQVNIPIICLRHKIATTFDDWTHEWVLQCQWHHSLLLPGAPLP